MNKICGFGEEKNEKREEEKMRKIYIFGSINTDLVISSPYVPKSGETVTGGDFFIAGGGKGANQAVAAARLGGNVKFCGAVGNDGFGNDCLNAFKKENIDVSCVRAIDGVPTGVAVIVVAGGDNRIILDKGANAKLCFADADKFLKEAEAGDVFLTQLENPVEVVGYALQKAKEKGMFTVLNPAPANKEICKYFAFVDLITPNESELELFGGKGELFSCGVKKIVTTLGSKGYEIADEAGAKVYPCVKVLAVDTTAAGDTLCGGLVVGLASGKTLEEACAFGSKAASIACTRKGAQPSIPTAKEVEDFKG